MEVIYRDASKGSFIAESLFDRIKIRENWLLEFETRRKAGTVKSYLHSLCFFYKYLLCDVPAMFSAFIKDCPTMIVIMENWIATYRKMAKNDKWKNDMKQLEQLITASDVRLLDNSEIVSQCRKFVKEVISGKSITFKLFTSVRDYLLMYICLNNASRTGAISNMTCEEFLHAKIDGTSYLVSVFDHKTLSTAGPAIMCFSTQLYNEATVYFRYFRNKLQDIGEGKPRGSFFVSWDGKKMSSSMVSAQINSFWNKAVGRTEKRPRVNATLIRKSCVTKTHNLNPDMEKDLANLMCHSTNTAKKSYFLEEKSKNAAKTSLRLQSILRQPDINCEESCETVIYQNFREEIENEKITLTLVRAKKESLPELSSYTDIQLRDKIRYMISQKESNKIGKHIALILCFQLELQYMYFQINHLALSEHCLLNRNICTFTSDTFMKFIHLMDHDHNITMPTYISVNNLNLAPPLQ